MFLVSCWSAPGKVISPRIPAGPNRSVYPVCAFGNEPHLNGLVSRYTLCKSKAGSPQKRPGDFVDVHLQDISLNLLLHVDARHLKGLALTAFQACSLSDNRPASIRIPTWLMFHFAVSTKSVMALSACFISWGVYRFVVEDKYLSLAPCYLALHSSFSSHDTPDETALETFSTNLFCPFSFVSVINYLGAGLLSFAQAHPFFLIHRVSICHVITCAGRNANI